ncbi:hypothetical protein PIB30_076829 [Stylosanthes scabra]|uniref:Putative plant transposon protein domain-containing protein n=1 Tax=Stylosanthes scabra TaxID=79078 RepID=A0ABU6SQS7_9FABA|nr:hypothetical protein [Stylosanthes scabra]
MGVTLIREFYANAKMTSREKQDDPHLITFVRRKAVDFSLESIRVILQFPRLVDTPQSYEARKAGDDQRLNDVLRDISEAFATWKLDKDHNPSQLKHRELNPTTKGWYEFVRRSLLPSSNNSKVTVERVVLIRSIMEGLDVKAEKLISDNILAAAESKEDRSRHPFLSIIYRLLYENRIQQIRGDELVPIERLITAEGMERNRYIQIQQEVHQ